MKNILWKLRPILIFLVIPIGIMFTPSVVTASVQANAAVYWTPHNPVVGDVVTIQYNTTAGALSSSLPSIYLQWAFDFLGNYDYNLGRITPVLPAKSWYPPNSARGYGGFFLSSPMTNITSEIWEINITVQDTLPNRIRFFFSDTAPGSANRDGSQNSAWYIDPLFATDGLFIIDPSVAETNFLVKSDDLHVTVRGNSTASNWVISLEGRSTSPLACSVTASTFDVSSGLWSLTASLPASIDVGLYDLKVTASVGGNTWSDIEANAVQILDAFKDSYTIALIGDQEMNYASPSSPNGIVHGGNNLSDLLEELAVVNPDIFVNLGSVTFWGDIETMKQYVDFIEESYDLPHIYVASHRDRFIGNEADWPYTGAGMGALEKIVGIRHKQWNYGDHYYSSIYTGDHRMDQSELDWFSNSLSSASESTKILMIHDPIGYETDYNPTSQNAIDESGRAALAPIIKSNGFDYYIHSSAGVEGTQQVIDTGAFHIGTKSVASGYYLLKVSANEITDWSYDETNMYYPWHKVNVTYNGVNDGTEESSSATIHNSLTESLDAARVVFKMSAGSEYTTDVGTIYSQYEKDGIKYVEAHVPVALESVQTVQILEEVPVTTTTTTTTVDEPPTTNGTSGFEIFFGFFALVPIVYRKRKR